MLSGSDDLEDVEENVEVRLETSWEASYCPAYGCGYEGELIDLEKKGLWLEILERKDWISVSRCWTEQQ